jgi:hypothetical protein
MKQMVAGETSFPPCGYGLVGLCCSACLLGPCRISPFDEGPGAGRCGDDADRMVAAGLRRLAGAELLESMGRLVEAAEKLAGPGFKPRTDRTGKQEQALAGKYGYPDNLLSEAFSRRLLNDMEILLSPMARGPQSLLNHLIPEKTFPYLRGESFFNGSPVGTLLRASTRRSGNDPSPEEDFQEILSIGAAALLCEELSRDLSGLAGDIDGGEEEALDPAARADEGKGGRPVVFLQAKGEDSLLLRFPDLLGGLAATLGQEVFPLVLAGAGRLPGAARALFEQGPGSCRPLLFVASPRVTWTLGALAFGFSVISCPALPIHGSEQAERFFLKDLPKERGQVYFAFREEDRLSVLLDGLKGAP